MPNEDQQAQTQKSEPTTSETLAIFSLLLFALTVLPVVFVGLYRGKLDADLVKFY